MSSGIMLVKMIGTQILKTNILSLKAWNVNWVYSIGRCQMLCNRALSGICILEGVRGETSC